MSACLTSEFKIPEGSDGAFNELDVGKVEVEIISDEYKYRGNHYFGLESCLLNMPHGLTSN